MNGVTFQAPLPGAGLIAEPVEIEPLTVELDPPYVAPIEDVVYVVDDPEVDLDFGLPPLQLLLAPPLELEIQTYDWAALAAERERFAAERERSANLKILGYLAAGGAALWFLFGRR